MADRNNDVNQNRVSPYKKVQLRNTHYCGYVSVPSLDASRAYKIMKLVHTNHSEYGEGELAFVVGWGQKWKTQLLGKYLSTLTSEDIEWVRSDADAGKNPYLVCRRVLADKSFKIDLIEKDSELVPDVMELHGSWKEVPKLPEVNEVEPEANVNGQQDER